MDDTTREKFREWTKALDKLDEPTKEKEAYAWIVSALDILESDPDFQKFCKEGDIPLSC